jgi:hypothetical protein
MYASVALLHGRGTAYAALITRRISTTSLQNPKFFRPELRSGLKQRQEVSLHMFFKPDHQICQIKIVFDQINFLTVITFPSLSTGCYSGKNAG